MAKKSITDYIDYLKQIKTELLDKDGVFELLQKNIEDQFLAYGFTNVEKAEIIAQMNVAAIQFLDQFSTAGAIELIKTDKQNELVDAQKDKIAADIRLIDAEIKLLECRTKNECDKNALIPIEIQTAQKNMERTTQSILTEKSKAKLTDCQATNECARGAMIPLDLTAKSKEIEKTSENIKAITASIDMTTCQSKNECDKNALIPLELKLKEKQNLDVSAATALKLKQALMVKRQTENYNDNMLVKAAEFQGGVASYALNAAAPKMDEIVEIFNKTVMEVKGRS